MRPATVGSTRERILVEAARLFAYKGFHGTPVEDIGAACGVSSGPGASTSNFPSKVVLLGEVLTGISEYLLEGGRAVVTASPDQLSTIQALLDFHVDFALTRPELIRVQDRDLPSLREDDRSRVRRLQRAYVELWCDAIVGLTPTMSADRARTRPHAVFGLLNSTPHSARSGSVAREELVAMSRASPRRVIATST